MMRLKTIAVILVLILACLPAFAEPIGFDLNRLSVNGSVSVTLATDACTYVRLKSLDFGVDANYRIQQNNDIIKRHFVSLDWTIDEVGDGSLDLTGGMILNLDDTVNYSYFIDATAGFTVSLPIEDGAFKAPTLALSADVDAEIGMPEDYEDLYVKANAEFAFSFANPGSGSGLTIGASGEHQIWVNEGSDWLAYAGFSTTLRIDGGLRLDDTYLKASCNMIGLTDAEDFVGPYLEFRYSGYKGADWSGIYIGGSIKADGSNSISLDAMGSFHFGKEATHLLQLNSVEAGCSVRLRSHDWSYFSAKYVYDAANAELDNGLFLNIGIEEQTTYSGIAIDFKTETHFGDKVTHRGTLSLTPYVGFRVEQIETILQPGFTWFVHPFNTVNSDGWGFSFNTNAKKVDLI